MDSNEFVWANIGVAVGELVFLSLSARYALRATRRVRDRSRLRSFRRTAQAAHGIVVDNQAEWLQGHTSVMALDSAIAVSSNAGGAVFRPVVRFETQDGTPVTFAGRTPSSRQWIVGSSVPVSYDPGNPSNSEVTGETRIRHPLWPLLKLILCLMVLAYLVAAQAFYLMQGVNE
ncbi:MULTISPECIES: DUF3592 domain-containing protein [Actinomadura]|uniref:DUF3592 domain-containing protein n=1 Tax=Actinomadura madurae TaxID=1993 RepID=A0A1I5GT89_9ACTN|nr:DUF3592 domain-containing protein [Actinomadura madurae]SFO39218.1 hypothetical protein SAMN04489713_105395 [Actinomadura madurae]SPT51509.1 Protein of uncharacterised function (DUF3592) [Actinomadura madurae]